jgi:hypothetical protein
MNIKTKLKAGTSSLPPSAKAELQARGEVVLKAARVLIGVVRMVEIRERNRSLKTELEVQVDLTAGGTEQWLITIERTASSH